MIGSSDLRNLHVLLVGGRPASVQILRTAFGLLGMKQVTAVAESERAIETLRSQAFDAIFCDAGAEPFKNMSFPAAARRANGVLNPMTPLVLTFQRCLYAHPIVTISGQSTVVLPLHGYAWYAALVCGVLVCAIVLFFVGLAVFGRLEGNFAEEL